MWNRDPASPSFGSFDRLYWGWKFKDFSDATLQYAAKLVLGSAIDGRGEMPARWLEGFVSFCRSIQHPDGSFDQCYPHERTPGVVYDILSTLIEVHESGKLLKQDARDELRGIIGRAAEFALRTDEKHGEVANHIAEFAYELLRYAEFSGDQRAQRRGHEYLERLLRLFNREEGWFHEYHGPDAGYQSRALRYVVKCAALTKSAELWDVAERGARFVGDLLMPDGSIHPMLGVRSTALLYPSAFELLAARKPEFAPIARSIRSAWERGLVPLPSLIDFQNAIRLADDARDAALAVETSPGRIESPSPARERMDGAWKNYPAAGIAIRRSADSALYVGYRLGGAVVFYDRDASGEWRLAHEDAGYLFQSEAGTSWVSRHPDAGELALMEPGRLQVRSTFHRSLHDELTPFRMVILRIMNLTVLRSQFLGDLFRKVVVRHLMGKEQGRVLALERDIEISADSLAVTDRIRAVSDAARSGRLFRCRRITGMHMASSRYFQPVEMNGEEWMTPVEWRNASATNATVIRSSEVPTIKHG